MRIGGRVFFACLLFFLTLASVPTIAQGARMRSENSRIEEEDRDHFVERDRWFMRGRVVPGKSSAELRYRAHQQKLQLRAARRAHGQQTRSEFAAGVAVWTSLGPAPLASDASGSGRQDYGWVSGRATAVAVDAADPSGNTIYAGGAYAGVWKSTNAGPLSPSPSAVRWIPITDDQATLAVGAIAIQPQLSNPDPTRSVILVGTGETNSSADSYYGLGILRSPDAGNTWTLITQSSDSPSPRPFKGLGFSKLAFSTANPQLVVASTAAAIEGIVENLEDPPTVNRGIYYSPNAGVTWKYASLKDVNTTIAPGSVTSVIYNAAAGKFYAAVRYHGFYLSGDGINWTRLPAQPGSGLSAQACPSSPSSSSCPIYRGELTVVPGRNEMYAWYVDSADGDQGIWRTTDGGATWSAIDEHGIADCGDYFGCGTQQGSYNLVLAAVPNGTITDLYAGAINVFKCRLDRGTTCIDGGWLNLTHVYGCSSIAKFHPDQHATDFAIVNDKELMYFANDGGIYRALDGYTGLTTGDCGATNQVDSLNQTLGSMTQVVSFSNHPTDANTILGGTQDNGSPATASSQTGTQWINVNAGDGGYNAINPHDTDEWFTANTGVSIQRCTLGIDCRTDDFLTVVQPANLGGDQGAFYTPYFLDPQSEASELIVGTCRVWRGPGSGETFTQLSINFETHSPTGACTDDVTNFVRSMAAGGPKDDSGFSKTIYAGTDSFGPQFPRTPSGGHVWVTTNAAGGTSTWFDRTGAINPQHFPVSSVAVDTSDPLGLTAYVTIMGFGVSHVWKTANGGSSWTDFTGNLPDAPANAIAIDPGPDAASGTVFVGTDVGVFFSGTASANWTELGPEPGGGQSGYLPNVAVTALHIFNIGTTKLLRASTYGRGLWQYPLISSPDFAISLSHARQTIFPGQAAAVDGVLTAFNGYDDSVSLSCTADATPPPGTCDLVPDEAVPTQGGASFTLTAGGAVGDYHFNVQGVGADSGHATHDAPVTLHVVDFGLTAPSPGSTTANRPNDSDPITFQVTGRGSFNGSVSLSCSGLPAGASCNFSPADTVSPTANSPVNVTLVVSTAADTPTGTTPVTIIAETSGAPAAKTQNFSLTITALADFTIALNMPPPLSAVNQPVVVNGSLTAFQGYASDVNLSCGTGNPSTCIFNPASVTPTSTGAPFTLTLNSSTPAKFSFSAKARGTDPANTTHSVPVTLTFFDFDVSKPEGQSVSAGQTARYTLQFTPQAVSTFQNKVTYSCASGLPGLSTCSFSPTEIDAGSTATAVTLSVQTTAPIAQLHLVASPSWYYALWLSLPGLLLAFVGVAKRRATWSRAARYFLLILPFILGILMIACGGGGDTGGGPNGNAGAQPGTPPGTYTITVQASSGTLAHSVEVTLTVK